MKSIVCRCLVVSWLICLILHRPLYAQELMQRELHLLSGPEKNASLAEFPHGDFLNLRESRGETSSLPLSRLVRFGKQPVTRCASGVLFIDGSFVAGRIQSVGNDAVEFAGDYFQASVSMTKVRAIAFNLPPTLHSRSKLIRQMKTADGGNDLFHTAQGDRVSGVLQLDGKTKVAPTSVWVIQAEGASKELRTRELRSIVLSPVLHKMLGEQAGSYRVGMDDGSVLSLPSGPSDDGATVNLSCGVKLTHRFGAAASRDGVCLVEPMPGAPLRLSRYKTAAYKQTSMISSVTWPMKWNEWVDGQSIRIANHRYWNGLAMHARSQAVYAVPADVVGFQAQLGVMMLDSAVGGGSVVFRVLGVGANGKASLLYKSAILRSRDRPIPLAVPLSDVRLLLLIVDDAGDGDSGDVGVWLDPRFCREFDELSEPSVESSVD